ERHRATFFEIPIERNPERIVFDLYRWLFGSTGSQGPNQTQRAGGGSIRILPYRQSPFDPDIMVCLWDLVGMRMYPTIYLPSDVEVGRLLPGLAETFRLLRNLPYELRLKTGRTLRPHQTLLSGGVNWGDTLFLLLGEQ